jgi:hypothetical protein
MSKKQKQASSSPQEQGKFVDWLLTGGLAVFLLLVFRVGWVQAFMRLQYWVWMLLPFLRRDSTTFERNAPPTASSSAMSRVEAAMILGVDETASEIEIQKAYKQLMLKLHPDAGGNGYLAGKLNEARDCLMRR